MNIALGLASVDSCPVFDDNADGQVTIDELLRAVNAALNGCTPPTPVQIAYRVYGLNFSPYLDRQDPNSGVPVGPEQLRARMQRIAPYTQWVRSFGSTNGLEAIGPMAHSMGLKAAIGAWLNRMPDANEHEIANLIAAATDGAVDMAIVGSETLLRGDLTPAQLISYLDRVRQALPSTIPVTTADTCQQLLQAPQVVEHADAVFMNDYPYFAGVPVRCAVAALHFCYQQLTAIAGGNPVIVSESGWPSCGETRIQAVPSPENASFYFLNLVSWARANNVAFFYFEAFDETWKAAYEGTIGACWGVWSKDGKLKPGTERVFEDEMIPDNWSDPVAIGCDVALSRKAGRGS